MPEALEIVPQKEPPQPAPQTPAPVAAEPELTAAEYMSGFVPSVRRRFDMASADPDEPAEELAHVDKSLQAPILTKLQQQRGNRHVQRLMRHLQRQPVQRYRGGAAALDDTTLADRIAAGSQSGGQPLDHEVAQAVGGTLGAEVGGVRVHTGGEADALARDLDALAFTTGSDIFVSQAAPDLASPAGQHLLAHEAAHTVQQAGGPVEGTPQAGGVSVSDPSDRFEQAAEAAASAALAEPGGAAAEAPTPPLFGGPAPLHRGSRAVQRFTGDDGQALPLDDKPAAEEEHTITIDEKGVTTGTYNAPAYKTKDEVQTQTEGTKPEENLVDITGKVEATFSVTTSVNLPTVPDGLTACQKKRVQDAITNQLKPHEDQHVTAMKGYDGSYEEEISVKRVAKASAITELSKVAKAKADAEAAKRKAAAQAASDALDNPPFVITVDLNCKDEKAPDKKSAAVEGAPEEIAVSQAAEAVQLWRGDQPWPAPVQRRIHDTPQVGDESPLSGRFEQAAEAATAVQRLAGDDGQALPLADKPDQGRTFTINEKGVTSAAYNPPSYKTKDEEMTQSEGTKPEENLVDVTATVEATFSVTTRISLPTVPSGLTACQIERVQAAIDTQLAPHENAHVAAMQGYNGSYEAAIALKRVPKARATAELIREAKQKVNDEAAKRKAAAQAASDALDAKPFVIVVDLNCKDEKAPEKKSAEVEGAPGAIAVNQPPREGEGAEPAEAPQ